MECKHARSDLTLLLLGDVTGVKAQEIRDHLQTCPDCRAERDVLAASLEALRALPETSASPERLRRLMKAAAAEPGRVRPSRSRLLIFAGAAAVAAVACVLALVLSPDRTAAPAPAPVAPGKDVKRPVIVETTPAVPVGSINGVAADGRLCEIRRTGTGDTFPVEKGAAVWLGDEITSNDPNARIHIKFTDALSLTVEGKARFTIRGREAKNYIIGLDRGRIRGWFNHPIESLQSRKGALVVDSPVGMAQITRGQGFEAEQLKVDLFDRSTMTHRDGSVSVLFCGVDLLEFASRHLQKILGNRVAFRAEDLKGHTLSVVCNQCPPDLFVENLDRSLASMGLTIHRDGQLLRIEKGPVRQGDDKGWTALSYGEFRVRVPEKGQAKIQRKDRISAGALLVSGGQEGRVRPGVPGEKASLRRGSLEVSNVTLKGTVVGVGQDRAELIVASGGTSRRLVLSRGQEFDGYKVAWIWWDRVALEKGDGEALLTIGKSR